MTVRVIPRLDIKGPNLVKGIHLEGLRVLGKPEDFARHYYEGGADELFYQDAVASLYGRNSLLEIIQRTSREVFIPLCVGGGLRTVDDIRAVLRAGADKVSINTAALERPEFVTQAARTFGSSTIVVGIEAVRQPDGRYACFTDSGRQETGIDALTWAEKAVDLGAGELLVTSVDREGTGKGFDLELVRGISEVASVPMIAHGGAGSAEHVVEAVTEGRADAVCLASILHYETVRVAPKAEDRFAEGNTAFLRSGAPLTRVSSTSIGALKEAMQAEGVEVRPVISVD